MNEFQYYDDTETIEFFSGSIYYIQHWYEGINALETWAQADLEDECLKVTVTNGCLTLTGPETYANYLSKWDFEVRVDFPSLKRAIIKLENACA